MTKVEHGISTILVRTDGTDGHLSSSCMAELGFVHEAPDRSQVSFESVQVLGPELKL